MTTQPRPIFIDCDPGVDDSIAILLALASPELEVRAIGTVCGNVPVATGTANALKVLELAGRSEIDVHRGCEKALLAPPLYGKFHGAVPGWVAWSCPRRRRARGPRMQWSAWRKSCGMRAKPARG